MAQKMDIEKIFRLRAKGLTHKQIAEEIGTTEQVIKNAVYRATKQVSMSGSNIRPRKPPKPELSPEKTEALVQKYEGALKHNSVMKEENAGRARAANLYVLQCLQLGRFTDTEDINTLYAAFEAFVKLSVEMDIPLTMSNAALAIGVNKNTIAAWAKGNNPEKQRFAESVRFAIQAGVEACMAAGIINPVVGIWWEKSHFDMIEAGKQEEVKDDPLGEKKTAKEIMEEYQGLEEGLPDD